MKKITMSLIVVLVTLGALGALFAYQSVPVKAEMEDELSALRCRVDIDGNGRINIYDLAKTYLAVRVYEDNRTYNISYDHNRNSKLELGDYYLVIAFWDERPTKCLPDNERLGIEDWITKHLTCRASITSDRIINPEDVFVVGRDSMDINKDGNVDRKDAFLVRGYEQGPTGHCY